MIRRSIGAGLAAASAILSTLLASCGGSPTMVAPTPQPAPPPTTPPPQAAAFGGSWAGSASDSQGATTVSWSLTQSGDTVSGTVSTQAVNPNDGSCNSCHRNKSGTVAGTISGTTLTVRMFFAAGVDGDPTPACSATLTASAIAGADRRVTGQYS